MNAVLNEWEQGVSKTLLVLPTGCGKTIVFAKISEQCVIQKKRVLILAHRGELLEQATDKIFKVTGLKCATEKAEESCLGSWYRIVVGSVQTLMCEKRLANFSRDYFDTIIIDEAHHSITDSYQNILMHFPAADVLGVTATPDRGDMKNLGQVFESLAYEYTLPKAIKEGYLSPIKAVTIPLNLDLTGVGTQAGDFKASDIDTALDPPEVKNAKNKLLSALCPRKPAEPYKCAVRLTCKWLFPKGSHKDGEYRTTKPDTDNLQKMLKDCMTKSGFWEDDALVASEICEKFWAEVSGIYIKIEELM